MKQLIAIFLILLLISCKKKEDPSPAPEPTPAPAPSKPCYTFAPTYTGHYVSVDTGDTINIEFIKDRCPDYSYQNVYRVTGVNTVIYKVDPQNILSTNTQTLNTYDHETGSKTENGEYFVNRDSDGNVSILYPKANNRYFNFVKI